jgi:hypothetical protein
MECFSVTSLADVAVVDRENDADDLEAMALELLGMVEGARKGLPGRSSNQVQCRGCL